MNHANYPLPEVIGGTLTVRADDVVDGVEHLPEITAYVEGYEDIPKPLIISTLQSYGTGSFGSLLVGVAEIESHFCSDSAGQFNAFPDRTPQLNKGSPLAVGLMQLNAVVHMEYDKPKYFWDWQQNALAAC